MIQLEDKDFVGLLMGIKALEMRVGELEDYANRNHSDNPIINLPPDRYALNNRIFSIMNQKRFSINDIADKGLLV